MTKFHPIYKALLIACFTLAFVSLAQAQATRTWVSGVGDDVNPCSRTAPCKTFAGAISKTQTNGEINCLDPGGFGAVTITKSLTIDCEDTQGSILASGTTGVIVNLTANPDTAKTVRLRGLTINGSGSGGITGLRGINVSSANTGAVKLFVDEVYIHDFVNEGIFFNGPGGDLVVRDSLITNCTGNAGIRTLSTLAGASGIIHATITRTTSHLNNFGFRFEGNTQGTITDSTASNNAQNGFVCFPATIGNSDMNIMDSTANDNRQFGVVAVGTGGFIGTIRIFNVSAFNNTTLQLAVQVGGAILSNGRNHIGTPTNAPGPFTDQ